MRSGRDSPRLMMNVSDPLGRLAKWRLSLSNFGLTVTYRPVLKNQVPDALYRCAPEYRDDDEVEDDIPIFGSGTLVLTKAQTTAWGAAEGIPEEEEVDSNDIWDELDVDRKIEITEAPVPISIREVLEAQQRDRLCQEILSGNLQAIGQCIQTDDIVLRLVPPREDGVRQIVKSEALQPRLLNLTHQAKLAGHPGQKIMYMKLPRRFS